MKKCISSLQGNGLIMWLFLWLLVLVSFTTPGDASVTVRVTVEGVSGDAMTNVLKFLSIEQQKDHPSLSEGLLHKLHERAAADITKALEPFGYYSPKVQGTLVREDSTWVATYVIDPGKQVEVTEINITLEGPGASEEEFTKLIDTFPIKKGDPLDHGRYERGKSAFQESALSRGYLDARFTTSQVSVYPERGTATISLHLVTGPRYRFGEVSFEQEAFRPEFLNRFVRFKRGDPLTLQRVLELQNALRNSDYFSEIDVQYRKEMAENLEVPVTVSLTPRKRNAYTFGIGYGTDTGVRGVLEWENRRINPWGHRMSAALRLSEIKSSLSARYTVPLANPSTDYRAYTAGWFREDTDTSESETFLIGLSYNHTYRRWRRTISLNYEREDFTVGSDSGRSDLLIPGISWTYTKANDRIYTTRGRRLLIEVKGSYEDLISDTTFIQLLVQPKLIFGVGGFGRFILRGVGGTTLADNFSDLPASHRFFAGGDQSVRGYGYETLGPVDENGDVIGGEHILVGSIEYEQKLYKKWSAAFFYDVGNAINKLSDSYSEGAGFGIRWASPVGLIRVDLAFALSKPGDPLRLHLTIGPDL
ncbi:MAG: BamA/TamA family outer membrane protein [Deltaproteobacteria bacterium]|nr:BamA/TamA family outer membrane protein [Deltaproteobacteria bacterium]